MPGNPPTAWAEQMVKDIMAKNPDYDEETARATMGAIWHHSLGDKKKQEITKRFEGSMRVSAEKVEGADIVLPDYAGEHSIFELISLAHSFHEGQWSSLYSFASRESNEITEDEAEALFKLCKELGEGKWEKLYKEDEHDVYMEDLYVAESWEPVLEKLLADHKLKRDIDLYSGGEDAEMITGSKRIVAEDEMFDETTPSEDDAFLQSTGPLGSKTSLTIEQKFIGEFSSEDEAIDSFKSWCAKNNFYPQLWRVSDHGNIEPISVDASRRVKATVFPNLFSNDAKKWIQLETQRRAATMANGVIASPEQGLAFIEKAANEISEELKQAIAAEVKNIVSATKEEMLDELVSPEGMVPTEQAAPQVPEAPMAPPGASSKKADLMKPDIQEGKWVMVDGPMGTEAIPADLVDLGEVNTLRKELEMQKEVNLPGTALQQFIENNKAWGIEIVDGYGARLSAPGYLDSTPWVVFDTETEAENYLVEMYDLED